MPDYSSPALGYCSVDTLPRWTGLGTQLQGRKHAFTCHLLAICSRPTTYILTSSLPQLTDFQNCLLKHLIVIRCSVWSFHSIKPPRVGEKSLKVDRLAALGSDAILLSYVAVKMYYRSSLNKVGCDHIWYIWQSCFLSTETRLAHLSLSFFFSPSVFK